MVLTGERPDADARLIADIMSARYIVACSPIELDGIRSFRALHEAESYAERMVRRGARAAYIRDAAPCVMGEPCRWFTRPGELTRYSHTWDGSREVPIASDEVCAACGCPTPAGEFCTHCEADA